MRAPSSHATGSADGTGWPTNVLLRSPPTAPEPAPCPSCAGRPGRRLLLVSLGGDPESRIGARERRQGLPGEVAVLTDGETRSAAAATADPGPTTAHGGTELSWASVSDAGALSELGVKIDRCLSSWGDGEAPVEVCFDSVSALLSAADLATVFRFLHVLLRRVDTANAVAHYHISPSRHGRREVGTVETLFEHVREYDDSSSSWVEP